MDRKMAVAEVISSIGLALLALVFTFYIIPHQIHATGGVPNERTFPYMAGGVLCVLSLMWVVDALRKRGKNDDKTTLRGIGVAFQFLILAYLQVWLGFIIAGILTAIAIALLIDERKWIPVVVFSVGIALVYYVFFQVLLGVQFPAGLILPK